MAVTGAQESKYLYARPLISRAESWHTITSAVFYYQSESSGRPRLFMSAAAKSHGKGHVQRDVKTTVAIEMNLSGSAGWRTAAGRTG